MESHGGMILTGENSCSVHQRSLTIIPANHLIAKQEEREKKYLALQSISVHTSKGSSTCRETLRLEAYGFTSPAKEGVLQIFIAFKNPMPRPGLNPRTLDPVA
jgi:hypothetical protein